MKGRMNGRRVRLPRWAIPIAAVGVLGITAVVYLLHGSGFGAPTHDAGKTEAAASTLSRGLSPSDATARPVRTALVSVSQCEGATVYPGVVRASQTAKLAFRVGGPLIEVSIKPGDHVRQSDVLMRIDPRDYENNVAATEAAIASAEAKLTAMRKGARDEDIRALEANLVAAVARRDYARQQHGRLESLVKQNAVAASQFDSVQSERTAAEAAVRAAEQELAKAKAGARVEEILAMEAEISGLKTRLKVAKESLEDTVLRAPFDGVITRRLAEQFEMVEAHRPATTMHNIALLEVDVHLPEQELALRDLSQPITVDVRFRAARDRTYTATLHELNTEADPATRTYLVTFMLPAPTDVQILPGMTAEVELARCAKAGDSPTLVVPNDALVSDSSGQDFVWVVREDDLTAEKRAITKGPLTSAGWFEVLDGLRQGERIVTAGASYVVPGMPLAPLP